MKTKILALITAVAGLSLSGLSAADTAQHTTAHAAAAQPNKQIALYSGMHKLWADHTEWTRAAVDAFYHNKKALPATMDRLMRNQQDIGNAIKPYYGKKAGNQLAALLREHIQLAVPVLTAAQENDKAALDKALADWNRNAQQIADFLHSANPNNWPKKDVREMMQGHIDTTTDYAVGLLKEDYAKAIKSYDNAAIHMQMMADILSKGIIAQFPQKF